MNRLVALLVLVVATLAPAFAQERHAIVRLDTGQKLEGRVIEMNLDLLKIEVAGKVQEIAATKIRSCRFVAATDPASQAALRQGGEVASGGEPGPEQAATGAPAAGAAGAAGAAATEPAGGGASPVGERSSAAAAKPVAEGAGVVDPAGKTLPVGSRVTWTGPLQDPVHPHSPESLPVDVRNRSHWQRRIGILDSAYPWLAPAAPAQWVSLGLLLLVGSGLIVHLSVHVSGGERPQLGRSVGLGIWYLITGLLQIALVPINDLSVALMILLNTSLSLFALCGLFGLTRLAAVVALLVQLGFAVLVHGVLELVTALLGSCGVAA